MSERVIENIEQGNKVWGFLIVNAWLMLSTVHQIF